MRILGKRNHKKLLKYIEEARDDQARTGSLIQFCAIRIIWHLTNIEMPVGDMNDLIESISDMHDEAGQSLPHQFDLFFRSALDELIEKEFIGDISKEFRHPNPEYILTGKYDNKQKKEIEDACWELLDKDYHKIPAKQAAGPDDEWFDNLEDRQKRMLHIQAMIDSAELALRRLVHKEYEKYTDWTRDKNYVDPAISRALYSHKNTKGKMEEGRIQNKANMATSWRGSPLSGPEAFLNACTLPELIEGIIEWKPGEFEDIFYSVKKQGKKFNSSKVPMTIFPWVKEIRNLKSHVDQQIPWDKKMVATTKFYCDAITDAVENYLNR